MSILGGTSMDNSGAEFLAKLLTTYGPGAGAVFLVFFAERKLRNAITQAQPGSERRLFSWLYAGQWALVGGLLIASTAFWLYWQKKHDPLAGDYRLAGSIIDLKNGEIRSRSKDGHFFYSISYQGKDKYTYDFDWIYLSSSPISKIEFRFEEGSSTEVWQDYQLTASDFSGAADRQIWSSSMRKVVCGFSKRICHSNRSGLSRRLERRHFF